MKTRSNMPLFVLEVSDVKALSNSQIDLLRCGDWLVKKDASGEHPYQVTFKKEGVGMCLTYHDASVIETQSYDFVDGNWVYNSEDKTPNLLDAQTEDDVEDLIEGGTISNAKPIYYHPITTFNSDDTSGKKTFGLGFVVLNNSATALTYDAFISWIKSMVDAHTIVRLNVDGGYDDIISVAYFYCFKEVDTYKVIVVGFRSTGYGETSALDLDTLLQDRLSFDDAVNKIN